MLWRWERKKGRRRRRKVEKEMGEEGDMWRKGTVEGRRKWRKGSNRREKGNKGNMEWNKTKGGKRRRR